MERVVKESVSEVLSRILAKHPRAEVVIKGLSSEGRIEVRLAIRDMKVVKCEVKLLDKECEITECSKCLEVIGRAVCTDCIVEYRPLSTAPLEVPSVAGVSEVPVSWCSNLDVLNSMLTNKQHYLSVIKPTHLLTGIVGSLKDVVAKAGEICLGKVCVMDVKCGGGRYFVLLIDGKLGSLLRSKGRGKYDSADLSEFARMARSEATALIYRVNLMKVPKLLREELCKCLQRC